MTQYNFTVSVLIRQEGAVWVAQGLEYDITAQGKNIREAVERFEKVFVSQVFLDVRMNKQPLQGVKQAPREYWAQFEDAQRLTDRRPFYLGDVPPAFMIAAAADDMRVYA
jgi:hypothetical protein